MSLATVQLKRLGTRNLEAALAKAEQYRALNQPEEAESICRDVLDEAPEDQHALRTLGLALTDRFAVAISIQYKGRHENVREQ